MLTRKDIDDLFELLAIFRKNDPHLSERGLRSAWLLVLSPYGRDEVRDAVGAWFRKSKYWPEPAEIAALCSPLPEKDTRNMRHLPSPSDIEDMNRLHSKWNDLLRRRREAGIPATVDEAEAAGIQRDKWYEMLDEKGLAWT